MIVPEIAIPSMNDYFLAFLTLLAVFFTIGLSHYSKKQGKPSWFSRKIIHVGISTVIALTLHLYSSFSGPLLVIGTFLLALLVGKLMFGNPAIALIKTASRENGTKKGTLFAGVLAILAYSFVFLAFPNNPEVFSSAILIVAWGDGAGELIGRPFGNHHYHIWNTERSIEGSVAVCIFSFLALLITQIVFSIMLTVYLFIVVAIIAITVTLIEAFSVSWSDNFLIPIAVGLLFLILI